MQVSGRMDRLALWFSLGHMANDWAPGAIWLIAPAVAVAMDLTPAELGLLLTLHSIGAALAYLPAGIFADRVADRGRLLLMTFWWVAAGYVLASFASGFWSLALLMAVAGMGDAAWHPVATGVLVQGRPQGRARMLGLHAIGGTLAEVFAPLSVGFLLVHFDWRTCLQISVLPALAMGIAFLFVARQVPRGAPGAEHHMDFRALYRIWRRPDGLGLIAMMVLYNMAFLGLLSMTPLFLARDQGFSPAETGLAFSSMLLAGALAQPLVGHLSDVTGRKPVVVGGAALAALAAVVVALSQTAWVLLLALVAAIAVLTAIRSAVLAAAVDFSGRGEAMTLGLAFMVLDGVGALGAVLAGSVGNIDLRYVFFLVAGLAAAAFALALPVAFGSAAREPAVSEGPLP